MSINVQRVVSMKYSMTQLIQKMNVELTAQLLSRSVADELLFCINRFKKDKAKIAKSGKLTSFYKMQYVEINIREIEDNSAKFVNYVGNFKFSNRKGLEEGLGN